MLEHLAATGGQVPPKHWPVVLGKCFPWAGKDSKALDGTGAPGHGGEQ